LVLNHMLITGGGVCGLEGSLVKDLVVEPTSHYDSELCLHKAKGSCGRCVARCVNNFLQENGFDKQRCHKMLQENARNLKDLEGPRKFVENEWWVCLALCLFRKRKISS